MLDAIVKHYSSTLERTEAASQVLHEIARRTRRAVLTSAVLKCCPSCNRALPHADFNRDATRPDGLVWRCRACQKDNR